MVSRMDWIISIENAATEVAALLGMETVKYVLRKYNADSIQTLAPQYFSEVFAELDFMAKDARD